jgi:recombination protein RecA
LRFYSSVRLDVRRVGKVSIDEAVVGNRTRVKVIKNKCSPPFTEAEFDIRWGSGIDALGDLIDVAVSANVLERAGAHYRFAGNTIAQGRERLREVLQGDAKLHGSLRLATMKALEGTGLRLVA